MTHLHLLILALPACGLAVPLGDHPLDDQPISESSLLVHLADALPDAAGVTAGDLVDDKRLDFDQAPDPSALFVAQAAEYAALPDLVGDTLELRVLTYNVGLLDRTYFAGGHVAVPHVAERAQVLPERVVGDDWDILLLQEVWEWEHVLLFAQAAEQNGYVWYAGTEKAHIEHGLMILVKESLVGGEELQVEVQFDDQRGIEHRPGPNIRRGYLEWGFTLEPTGEPVRLLNTHPQAFVDFWEVRTLQLRQVGLAASEAPADTLVLLGGDLNAGPYYPQDTFGQVDGDAVTGWWRNATAWPLVQHYGGLRDLTGAFSEAQDVVAMDALPAWSEAYLDTPLAGACDELPENVFSGTDCNSLYFENYGGQEYPARLDHLMWRDGAAQLRVLDSQQEYLTPEAVDGAGTVELSDHYGVSARVQIGVGG
jgi:endonuclease/exonuclease/phosphatase family metal-dependent hydrolase